MRISLEEFHSNISKILVFFLVLINLLLTFLPLTKTLGYEFSVVNGIFLFIIGGLQIIIVQRKDFVIGAIDLLLKNKLFISFSIIIPFLIGFLSSVLNSNCPIKDGILFYLVISIPSFFFGGALGNFCTALSRKYSFYFFIIISIGLIISPLTEFFFNPQIYFYNPIFGYFPGTIYDEDLSVDRILLAYRIFNVAFFILLFYSSRIVLNNEKKNKTLIVFILIFLSFFFSILKPKLFFATDKKRIEKELASTIITNNFQIHLPDSLRGDKENRYNALLHEYYLDQIKIQLTLPFSHNIDSYLFPGKESKRELLGSGNADIAKPWLKQIFSNYYNYGRTLKHELVHILAGEFGQTPFKVSADFNPAMIEGLAMAIENNYDDYPIQYMAKLAFTAGYKYPIAKLFSGINFFSRTSSISYIYAGSFLKYLEDKFGISKIKYLYQVNDFQKVYGKKLNELVKDYELFMENYQIEFNKSRAQLYFGGVSIFKKYCPRMAASEVNKAWELYKNKKYSEAFNLFKNVYNYSNSYQSLLGVVSSYSAEKNYATAEEFLNNQIVNFRTSQFYYNLELILGDLLIQTNQYVKAVSEYDSLIVQSPHINFTNEVLIRKSILEEGVDSLKKYLNYNQKQKYQKLLSLNSKGIKYFLIPTLINYSTNDNNSLEDLVTEFKRSIKVQDYSSSYAALEISKYALRNLDYETAQYFAVRSLDFRKDDNSDHMFIENLKMVNWFKNNHEEIKITYTK
ncbi:MAG: hypothetical protein NTZ27_03555 [Ignavibacteriales bacterium]|nr:hypothetical protein [Ignavibacteriales bacterium]